MVRTLLSTFAYSLLIPNLQAFCAEMGGVIVDLTSSLFQPRSSDDYDVSITGDLSMIEPADDWEVYNEQLVCVGSTNHVRGENLSIVRSMLILNITPRPDILPTWLRPMNITFADVNSGGANGTARSAASKRAPGRLHSEPRIGCFLNLS